MKFKLRMLFLTMILQLTNFSETNAQTLKIDSMSKKYILQEVIYCDTNLTRESLYKISKDWIVRNLKSSDNNILRDDTEFKQITATGNLKTNNPVVLCGLEGCRIEFKLTVNIKDGKIRYTIENIVEYSSSMTTMLEEFNLKKDSGRKAFSEIEAQLKNLASSFKQAISNHDKKDDW